MTKQGNEAAFFAEMVRMCPNCGHLDSGPDDESDPLDVGPTVAENASGSRQDAPGSTQDAKTANDPGSDC